MKHVPCKASGQSASSSISQAMIVGATIAILSSTSALAQGAAAGSELREVELLEEIVVTAEKRADSLQKTSLSVQAFTGEQLAREGKTRIDQIMSGLAGVQLQPGPTGANFSIRGFDGGSSVNAQTDAAPNGGVALVIDGVYQNRTETVRAGTLDLGQAEVMRGTQSTTLGGSSLIGAISLTSRQPVFSFEGNGSLEMGNYNLINTSGVLNVPLSDRQAIRMAFQTQRRDGYVSSNADNNNSHSERIKYRWQASDDLNIVLTAENSLVAGNGGQSANLLYRGYWVPATAANIRPNSATNTPATGVLGCAQPQVSTNADGTSSVTYATFGCPPAYVWDQSVNNTLYRDRSNPWNDGLNKNALTGSPHSDVKTQSYSANVDWNLGVASLGVVPSYQTMKLHQVQLPQGQRTGLLIQQQDTEQVDVRLASATDSFMTWLVGVNYYHTDAPTTLGYETYPGYAPFNGVTQCPLPSGGLAYNCYYWQDAKHLDQTTKAAYGNLEFSLLKNLRLLAGVRYQSDEKSVESSGVTTWYQGGNRNGPAGITFAYPLNVAGKWKETTYRGGLEYDLSDKIMAYAAYSTGYQPGTITSSGTIAPTKAQTLNQLTAGVKSQFFNDRLRVNLEAFDSEFHNYQLRATQTSYGLNVSTNTPIVGCLVQGRGAASYVGGVACTSDIPNAKSLDSRGVDLDVSWLMTRADRLDLGVEYLDTAINEVELGTLTTTSILGAVVVNPSTTFASAVPNAATVAQQLLDGVVALQTNGVSGQTLQNSPKWSVNATYQHSFNFADGSKLTPRVNYIYKTEYWTSGYGAGLGALVHGPAVQPSYSLWNAFLGWSNAKGNFDATAYVKNISAYPVLLNYNSGPAPWPAVTLGDPRTWGVILSARF